MSTSTPPEKLLETTLKLAREAAAADVRALPCIVPAVAALPFLREHDKRHIALALFKVHAKQYEQCAVTAAAQAATSWHDVERIYEQHFERTMQLLRAGDGHAKSASLLSESTRTQEFLDQNLEWALARWEFKDKYEKSIVAEHAERNMALVRSAEHLAGQVDGEACADALRALISTAETPKSD